MEDIRNKCVSENPEIESDTCPKYKEEAQMVRYCGNCEANEIRPIRLGDVLLMLEDTAWAKDILDILGSWNLRTDSLDDQPEEVIRLIHSIIK